MTRSTAESKREFVTSAVDAAGFPKERLPELAFVGRSNVGKSSLINALVRQKVARTSAAPGKTRLANFYRVTPDGAPPFYLVDLPGYGYARGGDAVSARVRGDRRRVFLASGHERRGRVCCWSTAVIPASDSDRQAWRLAAARWTSAHVVVATKVDKLTRSERVRHVKELERLHEGPVLGVSVQTGEGLKELWKTIDALLRQPTAGTAPRTASRRPADCGRAHRHRRTGHAGPDDAQGNERHGADQDRAGARDPRRDRHAQAGADLRDPARARRQGRPHLLRGRARSAARRLRLPARAGLQLPGRPGRHLRVARRRFASSTCTPATPSPDRFGRRRKASATSRSSRSRRSTSSRRAAASSASSSRTSRRSIRRSASSSKSIPRTSRPASWT